MTSAKQHIPALDGLRFFAALFVVLAHYSRWILNDSGIDTWLTQALQSLSGFAMTLFFILSGFVIHYNYHASSTRAGGRWRFFIARFTRLYPLFFVLFMLEFLLSLHYRHSACGMDGVPISADFRALPFYLTFTQSWIYTVICHSSLLYQYYMVSQVSWSLSVEAFFYLTYLLLACWFLRQQSRARQLAAAAIAYLCMIGFFLLCWHFSAAIEEVALSVFGAVAMQQTGYQDSLIRWLYYFNPLVNLVAFFCGTVAGNIYLSQRGSALSEQQETWGNRITLVSIIAALGVHFWFYTDLAYHSSFIGRTGSSLYVPLLAVMVYCLARYPAAITTRFIGSPMLVKLGEASYSMYLLHAFARNGRHYYYLIEAMPINPWFFYAICVIGIIGISRLCYLGFERPVQRWLRKRLGT